MEKNQQNKIKTACKMAMATKADEVSLNYLQSIFPVFNY